MNLKNLIIENKECSNCEDEMQREEMYLDPTHPEEDEKYVGAILVCGNCGREETIEYIDTAALLL